MENDAARVEGDELYPGWLIKVSMEETLELIPERYKESSHQKS